VSADRKFANSHSSISTASVTLLCYEAVPHSFPTVFVTGSWTTEEMEGPAGLHFAISGVQRSYSNSG